MMAKLPSRLATRTELAAAPMAWLMAVAAMLLETRTPAHSCDQKCYSAAYAKICRNVSDGYCMLSPHADISVPWQKLQLSVPKTNHSKGATHISQLKALHAQHVWLLCRFIVQCM